MASWARHARTRSWVVIELALQERVASIAYVSEPELLLGVGASLVGGWGEDAAAVVDHGRAQLTRKASASAMIPAVHTKGSSVSAPSRNFAVRIAWGVSTQQGPFLPARPFSLQGDA